MNEIIIVGNGKMAEALCRGLKGHFEIVVVGRDDKNLKLFQERLDFVKIANIKDVEVFDEKTVILCVKPYALQNLSTVIKGLPKLLISVLAGVSLEKIQTLIAAKSYARAMPNIATTYGKSMTTITGFMDSKELVTTIFALIGQTLWVNTQKELDIATAIAGSGPAYLALIAEALIDGGVKMGLARNDALKLTRGLFDGFGFILRDFEPSAIKNNVMSPAGTTAYGLYHLEERGVRGAFMGCVEYAYLRAVELGKNKI